MISLSVARWRIRLPETLPRLTGTGLRIFSIIWAATIATALIVTVFGTWQSFKPYPYRWLNYGLSASSSGSEIFAVTGQQAQQSGIRAGDEVLAIDGRPMRALDFAEQRRLLDRPEGAVLALTLRNAQGEVRTHRLTRAASNTREVEKVRLLQGFSEIVSSIAFLIAAALLFRRRREPVPALLALAFATNAATANTPLADILDIPFLSEWMGSLSLAMLLVGLAGFPDGRIGSARSWTIIGLILLYPPAVILRVGGPWIIMPYVLSLCAVVLVRMALRYRQMPAGIMRQQVRWGFFGLATGTFWLILSGMAFLAAQGTGAGGQYSQLHGLSLICSLFATISMVGGLLVSLLRYRLYDADTVIGRSAAYGVLTLGFVALFAAGEKLIETLCETYLDAQVGALAGGLAAALAAVLIVPLHHRVSGWAERRFQRQLLRLSQGLPQIVGDLRETGSVGQIAETVVDSAARNVQATRAAVLVGDRVVATHGLSPEAAGAWLDERDLAVEPAGVARGDATFPMRLPLESEAVGRVGWLVLGPRPDGTIYGKDERKALGEAAGPVARAIAIAGMRERRDGEVLARIRRLEDLLLARAGHAAPGIAPAPSLAAGG